MTPEEARAFKRRYERMNEIEAEELRKTPVDVKLRQLASLMASVKAMGWDEALQEGDEEVWRRWQRLRELDAAS